jgi:hypothetical protein
MIVVLEQSKSSGILDSIRHENLTITQPVRSVPSSWLHGIFEFR